MMHEEKTCPKCSKLFECKPGNITQCQCYGITVSVEMKAYIEQRYDDCLCRECLIMLKEELELFREKFIYK